MRSFRFLLAVLASLPCAGLAQSQESAESEVLRQIYPKKEKIVRSLSVGAQKLETSQGAVEITFLRIDPKAHVFRLALPKIVDSGGSSLARFRLDEDALAVFTGGFLARYSPAIAAGLVQKGTTILNEMDADDKVMKAVVCYSPDLSPIEIMDAKDFSKGETKGDCIQTGPFLIRDREPEDLEALDNSLQFPFSRGRFQRAFLLLNSQNEIVVGVSSPVSLPVLQELLRTPKEKDGFGATKAVGLSGTRTAGFIVHAASDDEVGGNVRTLLPNAVVVNLRQASRKNPSPLERPLPQFGPGRP